MGKVTKTPTGCWLYTGWLHPKGYGEIGVKGKTTKTHRLSWELHYGQIPPGLCVCHKCDVRNCVNPEHLFLGTYTSNNLDRKAKGRSAVGSRHGKVKLTETQVRFSVWAYSSGYLMQKELAKLFGVGKSTIQAAISGTTWCHLNKVL